MVQGCRPRTPKLTPPVSPAWTAASRSRSAPVSWSGQVGDERGRVQRLPDPLVVPGPVRVEVGRQVRVRVRPTDRADHPHLTAADGLPQRGQHTQLVGDPLHPAAAVRPVLDDRAPPLGRHDPLDRHRVLGRVEAELGPAGVPAQHRQRLDHQGVPGVGGAERQRLQQLR